MSEEDVLDVFPLSEERKKVISELTKTKDFRACILNALINSLSSEAKDPNDALAKYSASRELAKLLSLKATKIP